MVLLVTLDVGNAFNSAWYCHMLEALKNRLHTPGYLLQILRDYLKGCALLYGTPGRTMQNEGGRLRNLSLERLIR